MTRSHIYCFRVEGILDPRSRAAFQDFTITCVSEPRAETIFTARVADQSALHAILDRFNDFNLNLISLHRPDDLALPEPNKNAA